MALRQSNLPADYYVALDCALKYLGPRARSEKEIWIHLRSKSFNEDVTERVIATLMRLQVLDDGTLAVEFVDHSARAGYSNDAIAAKLRQKGLDITHIESEESDEDRARKVAVKRASQMKGVEGPAAMRRLSAYLQRRGYSLDVAYAAAREALGQSPAVDSE